MKKRNGFTLIELLVVVAIIAVLIALLLPALATARESAKQAVCISNMRQIGVAVNFYMNAYNGFIVPSATWEGASNPRDNPGDRTWYHILHSEKLLTFDFSDPKVLHCASHIVPSAYSQLAKQYVSYATNRYVCGFSNNESSWKMRNIESFENSPSTVIMIGERGSVNQPITYPWSIGGTSIYWWAGRDDVRTGYGIDWRRHSPNANFAPRPSWYFRDGKAGILLADGSGKIYTASFPTQPSALPEPLLHRSPGPPYPSLFTSGY
jgi:prepilin-type N-terminal cleavage/methylation domain-containing protein